MARSLAFVLGLLLPVLVWCAAVSISARARVFHASSWAWRDKQWGTKTPQPKPYYWPAGLQSWVQVGVKRADRGVSPQPGGRPGRWDWVFIRKIIFLIHGWMMYLYQIKQIQAQKQCIGES